jgi:hypothetical protein
MEHSLDRVDSRETSPAMTAARGMLRQAALASSAGNLTHKRVLDTSHDRRFLRSPELP